MFTTLNFTRCLALVAALVAICAAPAPAADDPAASKQKETELIGILGSDRPGADKAIACKQLAIHGSSAAVPALAPLLADEHLASWSRIALEAIPGPAADEALRQALPALQGRLLVGTINSIGVRRDAGSVDSLAGRLKDADAHVASAAAVALGHIGNDAATKALRGSLAAAPVGVRSAVAEGCILCAERLMADGKMTEATEIYDEVRQADVPKPRVIEATRGAILARKSQGVPLLVEQLKSGDRGFFYLGLTVARELPGPEVAEALAKELVATSPERAALLLDALADRHDAVLPAAVLEAVKNGPKPVRIAAIGVVGRLGDAGSLSTLLEIGAAADAELAAAAKAALAGLPGEKVNAEIAARLPAADVKTLPVLIELVGQRRIDATPALVKAIGNPDPAIRSAALTALGETIGAKDLPVLIEAAVAPKDPADGPVALQALRAACVRMPEREPCAAEVAAAMSRASAATKANLLETLAAVGGTKALETVAAAVKGGDESLQDTGSRLLGEWMTADAAPVLLDLAKTASGDKYQVRAMRGYIRIARQFTLPPEQRAEMCASALKAASRPEEQKLVLAVLERYPTADTFRLAANAIQMPGLKEDATRVALAIAQKIGGKDANVSDLLAKIGLDPMKVEIIKAEYGAGAAQKDVTEVLQRQVRGLPLIALPGADYNESFGDPIQGQVKQLKIQYRINGKPGEATFAENAVIMLPVPK